MECVRIPARRNPRLTSTTMDMKVSAPPVKMYNPKMVEYQPGSSDISQS